MKKKALSLFFYSLSILSLSLYKERHHFKQLPTQDLYKRRYHPRIPSTRYRWSLLMPCSSLMHMAVVPHSLAATWCFKPLADDTNLLSTIRYDTISFLLLPPAPCSPPGRMALGFVV
ncbi:uncharacterized protein BYT42DRAFT_110786 [Radiomyces spectabilis]|uniref:uncharacterized protein n=1 Tax=Radiomyces spectabilis TaxID=64574 RepID=UPI0022210EEF|nr:uncharacterized protein BYT42DRAFT_110786 [Radiomyces spectabilis]KAI8369445.1 hypothetical protein BYT42DRAFT_110786 [Radiomyces spectabilis]